MRLKYLLFVLLFPLSVGATRLPSDPDTFGSLDWSDVDEWAWTGRMRLQVDYSLDQKPSSLKNQNAIELGSFAFSNLWQNVEEPFEVGVGMHIGPERDTTHFQPYLQWNELRFTWRHKPRVSFGLLTDPIVSFDEHEWGENQFATDFDAGVRRWGLIPPSDLGLQAELATGWGVWTVQVTNGEGFPNSEIGPRKDVEVTGFLAAPWQEAVLKAQVFHRLGSYDNLGVTNFKIRSGLQFSVQKQQWNLGMIGMQFEDPIDAVNLKIAEGADLSANGGNQNRGALAEGWLRYRVHPGPGSWRWMLRRSYLKTDATDSGKDVQSTVLGVGRGFEAGMQLHLLFSTVHFGDRHSVLARDRQRWFLAWTWGLERRPEGSD